MINGNESGFLGGRKFFSSIFSSDFFAEFSAKWSTFSTMLYRPLYFAVNAAYSDGDCFVLFSTRVCLRDKSPDHGDLVFAQYNDSRPQRIESAPVTLRLVEFWIPRLFRVFTL